MNDGKLAEQEVARLDGLLDNVRSTMNKGYSLEAVLDDISGLQKEALRIYWDRKRRRR